MAGLKMRSGVFIPPYHGMHENPTLTFQRDLELVEWCERLGYEEAWFGEHHSGGVETIDSPEIMIAAAAQRTRTIMFGTGVVSLPYHHPLNVAQRIVQLDHLTKGRVVLGVGAGSLVQDAKMRGVDPTRTREVLEVSLDVILRLLRGETVSCKTEWFTLDNANLHLTPYTHPHPKVVVAASNTPSGGRLAGRHGLGLLCVTASQPTGFDALSSNWAVANEIAAEHGNTLQREDLRLAAPIHLAETREEAHRNVRFGIEEYLDYGFSLQPSKRERAKGMDPVEIITKHRGGIIGTPDDAVELINRFHGKVGDFGCFLQIAHNWADWEQTKKSYELYARFVVPRIHRSNISRIESLDTLRRNDAEFGAIKAKAISDTFEKHEAERAARHGNPLNTAAQ